jgi:hypothetical protein
MRVLGMPRKSVNEEAFSCHQPNDMCPQALHLAGDRATVHGVAEPAFHDLAIREVRVDRRREPNNAA